MTRKNIILIIIGVIVLAGIVTGIVLLLGGENTGETAANIKVVTIPSDNVTGMRITLDDRELDFVKKDGVWGYRDDPDADLDQSSTEAALTMVCYVYAQEKLHDRAEDLSAFGLDPGVMVVELELADGSREVFRFGSYTSGRDGVFFKYDGSDAIYRYSLDSFSILEKAARAMGDLSIDIDANSVEYFEIMRVTGERVPLAFERIPENERVGEESWLLTSPFTAIANYEAVSLIGGLLSAPRFSAYVGDDVLDEYGFTEDSAYIYARQPDGSDVKLLIGSQLESGRYYCMEEGRNGVYELAAGYEAVVTMGTQDAYTTHVLPVTYEASPYITLDFGERIFTLAKSTEIEYKLNEKTIDTETAAILYEYLSQLAYSGTADSAEVAGEPDIKVTVANGNGKLEFGFHVFNNNFYATELNGSGTVGGYVKKENMSILSAAFSEAAGLA